MLKILSHHDVTDGDVHPEKVEHVVELAGGGHHEGVGQRAHEGGDEAEVLHDLNNRKIPKQVYFLSR